MKSKFCTWVMVFVGLASSGFALNWIAPPRGVFNINTRPDGLAASPGASALFGWLGGFRALAADFLWLSMHAQWETRDLPGTQTLIAVTTTMDPRPIYFWLNGARILAYDLPAWRIAAEGGYDAVPSARRHAIDVEQARLALRLLETARRTHASSAVLWIEQANIELTRLRDVAAAAESYRRAWEQPNAPYYAARLHAELLRKLGRKAEAYASLRVLHPRLPGADEAAAAPLVLARIRELEDELGVPSSEIYRVAAK